MATPSWPSRPPLHPYLRPDAPPFLPNARPPPPPPPPSPLPPSSPSTSIPAEVLSWSQVVSSRPKISSLRKLDFSSPALVDSKWVATCLKSEVESVSNRLEEFVQGFLIGKKPYLPTLKKFLLSKWKLKGSFDLVKLDDGSILLKFGSPEEKKLVLDSGPHFVAGHVLALRPWRKNLPKGSTIFNAIPVWVQLPELPLEFWSLNSLGRIASLIGTPLFVDDHTANLTRMGFARICVEIAASKELLDFIWICSEGETPFKQKLVYEWKPKICLSCSSFFHLESSCPSSNSSASKNPIYGNTVGAKTWQTVGRKNNRKPSHAEFFPARKNPSGNGIQNVFGTIKPL